MSQSQYAQPVLLTSAGEVVALSQIPMDQPSESGAFTEAWLQEQLFQHPELLPVEDIDPAYSRLLPVCRELNTPAGPIDVLYVTPQGRLVVTETKLWRNPEARRKVIAQILDYAKELAQWDYEDLSREIIQATKGSGDVLLNLVKAAEPGLDEARFVDNVSRTLRTGRFLLLIVGDGIREGVGALAEFLDRYGSLDFTFGLVEIGVFDVPQIGRLLQPRILAKTMTIRRSVVVFEQPGGRLEVEGAQQEASEDVDPATAKRNAFYEAFWSSFLGELTFDDLTQPLAKPTRWANIYFPLPCGNQGWLSAYFAQSKKQVGVYLRFERNSAFGKAAYDAFVAEKETIEKELEFQPEWSDKDGKFSIATRMSYTDLSDPAVMDQIRAFFHDRLNRFVNVFRPRLERMVRELEKG
ncbi:MAG: DUF4268 domain-containing protein [Anaerolineae bacterium]|nr:DUF4268 domain-containing protein [Anaerolineae bacterium]